jgi:hypothetical protein
VAAGIAVAAPRQPPPKEKAVIARLTVHELDDSLFPELEREPGVYGIEPSLQRPGADARIPAPKEARAVLLVSYTLLAADVPWGSRWQLEAEGVGADGKQRRGVWELVPPPPTRENKEPVPPDPRPAPPGALDRGVFWVDLSAPLHAQLIRPGDTLTLRLAKAQAVLVLPAPPKR